MDESINISIPQELQCLAKIINKAGFRFYIVGGFVRDIFTGSCNAYENDIDTCGDCTPENFAKLIKNQKNIKLCDANYPLGTLKLLIGELNIEYTCFRKESYRGTGHHTPSKVIFTKDILLDAKRRDFSINALYLDPLTFEIIDFFNGRQHISEKIIKTVRDSEIVFKEDALRLLRMCRFSAKLGFTIANDTMVGAKKCVDLLKSISKERIGFELDKILCETQHLSFGIDAIYDSNINKIICPSVKKETAHMVCNAVPIRQIRWAVFLSNQSPKEASNYILNLSLGKPLANNVFDLINYKTISKQNNEHIILDFAKMGISAAQKQIAFISVFNLTDGLYLDSIYKNMIERQRFITYETLRINGKDIIDILKIDGPKIKTYKDKAYEYAILNPDKNNFKDLKNYLLKLI